MRPPVSLAMPSRIPTSLEPRGAWPRGWHQPRKWECATVAHTHTHTCEKETGGSPDGPALKISARAPTEASLSRRSPTPATISVCTLHAAHCTRPRTASSQGARAVFTALVLCGPCDDASWVSGLSAGEGGLLCLKLLSDSCGSADSRGSFATQGHMGSQLELEGLCPREMLRKASSIHPPIHPSTHPPIHPSTNPPTHPPVRPSVRPSIHPSSQPAGGGWRWSEGGFLQSKMCVTSRDALLLRSVTRHPPGVELPGVPHTSATLAWVAASSSVLD